MKYNCYEMTATGKCYPYPRVSWRFESIQNLARENNLTTWHTWATKASRVTTVHNDYQRVEPGPPYPSAIFHAYALVGCHPTQRPSKLLSLWELKKSRMRQYTTQTCSPGLDNQSLIESGGGYNRGALNFWSRPLSTFPSSILHFPLIALSGLQLCQYSRPSC
jgi:hypothetical protein